eukprot:3926389-Prorocentrum_lima.AAC.1
MGGRRHIGRRGSTAAETGPRQTRPRRDLPTGDNRQGSPAAPRHSAASGAARSDHCNPGGARLH